MQKITPHLWFDREAIAAANFYTSVFPNSEIRSSTVLRDTPSGDAETVSFTVNGFEFMAISAGPQFKINPSISFMVNFDPATTADAAEQLRATWDALSTGGMALMPLQEYPFSQLYGWIMDRFGVSWQLMLADPSAPSRPFIVPSLMFVGGNCGKAEEATDLYQSLFQPSGRGTISRYSAGMEPDVEGTIQFTDFQLAGQWFAAMDSAHAHEFTFNEATSLMVSCQTQEEIDRYWAMLSAVPEAEQCGWLKDTYGVSWQIVPSALHRMMANGTPEQIDRVTQAFLPMKKFDIKALEAAFEGAAGSD